MKISFWLKFSVLNLFIVALLGLYLRLKMAYELPLEQKNVLHAHSHFTFIGWISQTLMVLLINYIKDKKNDIALKKYIYILIANMICSYVILFTFLFKGYFSLSILFLTLSILISYVFSIYFYKDTKNLDQENSLKWFYGALIFNFISSLGTFFLGYTMAADKINLDLYSSSIYFYLHFQYNGWFIFGCIGLFLSIFNQKLNTIKSVNKLFYLMFISTIITYGLSILWLDIPKIIYVVIAFFGVFQFLIWLKMQKIILVNFKNELKSQPKYLQFILIVISLCLNIKFLLQALLFIPSFAEMAYQNRPFIIAFLHLVLLGVVSLFLLYYMFNQQIITGSKTTKYALSTVTVSIILNEIFLVTQGLGPFIQINFSYVNKILLVIAALLVISIGWLYLSTLKRKAT